MREFTGTMPAAPENLGLRFVRVHAVERFARACAVNMHMDMSQQPLCENSQVECRRPRLRNTFCASLRSRKAHGHVTWAILCEDSTVKCRRPTLGLGFVWACAVEMHLDIWEEPFYAADTDHAKLAWQTLCEPAQSKRAWTSHKSHFMREFTGKNAGSQMEHPDQAPAFTPTIRTPQCGHTGWVKKYKPSGPSGWQSPHQTFISFGDFEAISSSFFCRWKVERYERNHQLNQNPCYFSSSCLGPPGISNLLPHSAVFFNAYDSCSKHRGALHAPHNRHWIHWNILPGSAQHSLDALHRF